MNLKIRRVVTGHDQDGKARVMIDEIAQNVASGRPNQEAAVVWTTEGFPVNNDSSEDTCNRKVSTAEGNGSVFRVVWFGPGVAPRNHRTDSIDYAVVISGQIDMDLDGQIVTLKQGDVLVQRGTIHNWYNRTSEPCVIAFALIGAKPVTVGGRTLSATG